MNIFGLRQDAEKFVPLVIKKLLNDEVITVHGSKDQVGTRMYLHAFNLADAWLYLLKNTKPTAYVDDHTRDQWLDAYNIAGLEEVSNLDMVNKIGKILGKTPKVEFLDFHSARAGHDRRYALDSSKITALGWKAPVSFEKSLEDTVLWYLKDENKIWL
jgi:dTDP-glucose 4,6-dehydratase